MQQVREIRRDGQVIGCIHGDARFDVDGDTMVVSGAGFSIEARVLVQYLREVHFQSSMADAALASLDHESNLGRIFGHMQTFLTSAACVSKLIWPLSPQKRLGLAEREWRRNRGVALQQVLAVDDTSPLKDRSVRDALEHYDERLDKVLAEASKGPTAVFGDLIYATDSQLDENYDPAMIRLRHLNPEKRTMSVLDQQPVNISSVRDELQSVNRDAWAKFLFFGELHPRSSQD